MPAGAVPSGSGELCYETIADCHEGALANAPSQR